MPEDDTPPAAAPPHVEGAAEETQPERAEPPSPPEAVEMLLHRVTFPATKAEIVQRVGGKEIAVGDRRVTMDRLLAGVPGDAYATRETVARLVAIEVMRHAGEGATTKEEALRGP